MGTKSWDHVEEFARTAHMLKGVDQVGFQLMLFQKVCEALTLMLDFCNADEDDFFSYDGG